MILQNNLLKVFVATSRKTHEAADGRLLWCDMDFYHTKQWQNIRERALKRDGYKCRECARFGKIRPATQVHHIKPIEEAPELKLDMDNLISLCMACHNKKHPEKGRNSLSVNRVDKLY